MFLRPPCATFKPHMRHYSSKLLLFGEHIVLLGARALAMPVPAFRAHWAMREPGNAALPLQKQLQAFAASRELAQISGLDVTRFQLELQAGLYFDSNIPVGYGLGSSGALCAAVYDRYAEPKTTELAALKVTFAGMERYFHGQSSGIDPLTSYLNHALWIENKTGIRYFEPKPWQQQAPAVFLLDSKLPRQTSPLVQWFLEQSRTTEFMRLLEDELFPAHSLMLDGWQNGDLPLFWQGLGQVSAFQLNHFQPMIPGHLRTVWTQCLTNRHCLLKVCGAGGGGFVLGFAASKAIAIKYLDNFDLIFPFERHELVEK